MQALNEGRKGRQTENKANTQQVHNYNTAMIKQLLNQLLTNMQQYYTTITITGYVQLVKCPALTNTLVCIAPLLAQVYTQIPPGHEIMEIFLYQAYQNSPARIQQEQTLYQIIAQYTCINRIHSL